MISLFKFLALASAFSLVGILTAIAFMLPEVEGYLQDSALKLKKLLSPVAAIWALSSIGVFLSELAVIVDHTNTMACPNSSKHRTFLHHDYD